MIGQHLFGAARHLLTAGREGGSDDVARSASAHRKDAYQGREANRALPPVDVRVFSARELLVSFALFVIPAVFALALIWTFLP